MRRWRVTDDGGRAVSLDLCSEHSELLVRLFEKFPHGKRGKSVRIREVTTEEAIRRRASRAKTQVKKSSR